MTSATLPYDSYANSPVHRFYQMWQQFDCKASRATRRDPSGCKNDLWPWVEVSIGAGSNGKAQALGFNDTSTGEGSTAMGFYNVLQGDAPYLKYLADNYCDERQLPPVGDGWNRRKPRDARYGRRDLVQRWQRQARRPPHNELVAAGSPNAGVVDEIENPESAAGHEQLVHAGRLRRRLVRLGVLRRGNLQQLRGQSRSRA